MSLTVIWPADAVTCPACVEDECDHGLRNCPECGPVSCTSCDGSGQIEASQHRDWCSRCGMQGDCPDCDPERSR